MASQTVSTGSGEECKQSQEVHAPAWVVCVSDMFWDEHWSSEQQLASRMAARCNVVYVERPVSLLSLFTGSSDAPRKYQLRKFFKCGVTRETETLAILTLPPVLPFRYVWLVNKINEVIRLWAMRRALKKLGVHDAVLWIYAPDAGRIVGKLGEACSLYYCADDWAASDQWWNRATDIRKRESELAAKVDLIVGTSTRIAKRWSESHANVMFVSNGADVASFKQARDPGLPEPEDLRAIPGPRIGYVGFVDSRLDTRLYEDLSRFRPDWSFVILGPLNAMNMDLTKLRKMPNVHFIGGRTRAQLPAYLKHFDVCTIPYIVNTLSASIFPLKLFEYLAAGRPIVTSALPELLRYREYIRVAENSTEFEQNIELSLSDPLAPASEAFLDENSWDSKAKVMWDTVSQLYSEARKGF